MRHAFLIAKNRDIWGRRSGIDSRRVCIPRSEPERRLNQERRSGQDRRIQKDQSNVIVARRYSDRCKLLSNTEKALFLAVLFSVSLWATIIIFFLIPIIN